jgi:hypothetical protein
MPPVSARLSSAFQRMSSLSTCRTQLTIPVLVLQVWQHAQEERSVQRVPPHLLPAVCREAGPGVGSVRVRPRVPGVQADVLLRGSKGHKGVQQEPALL